MILRSLGDQEFDITKAVSCMCKYAVMLENPLDIRLVLEKAWRMATMGRPGPVWIHVPVDFQGMQVEAGELEGHDPDSGGNGELPPAVSPEVATLVLGKIAKAKRPVVYAGGGVRLSGGFRAFREAVERLGVPVVTYWNSIDLIEDDHPLYCGRAGSMGDRAGNFAVQNSDLLLAIGTRLSIRQVGYNWKEWARESEVVMVDVDMNEMRKHTIHVETPIWADARDFLEALLKSLPAGSPLFAGEWWRSQCLSWKARYPVLQSRQLEGDGASVNVYAFMRILSESLPEGSVTAAGNGACCVAGHQSYRIKKGTRFIVSNAVASMGYGLPAAIGACVGNGRKATVCLEGDGSVMMNLQELQTVVTNRLPVKIFIVNNQGYHSIRQTQESLFKGRSKVGIGLESGDLSFPEYRRVAEAFGLPYHEIRSARDIKRVLDVMDKQDYAVCEVYTDAIQNWEPKSGAKRLPSGGLESSPLEDMSPNLSAEELASNMFIPMVKDIANSDSQ
jgi:acetolactate synthase-1/2/3 large subunit